MPDSEDPKQVNNYDLRNSQFRGGLINANKVIAGQIGGDNYNLIQQQIVIEVGTTPQSKLPFLQREVFKPLIENRLALFGGRITVLTQITEFIKNLLSGYLVITAPAGFGKTSLMAKLVSEAPGTFAYHFFAPSISDHSITEEGFLKNVIEQMAQWHNYTDSLPEKLPDLKALYQSFLDRPLKHTHVLIIDGLDEVRGWNLTPYVSRRLPENLHIILTVRDVGQDWIGDYDLPKEQTEHLSLKGLSTEDVAEVIRAAGKQAIILADNHKFIDEVMTVAAYQEEPSLGADPFYLRLLAENAADGYLTLDNIVNQPKGLERYLDRWWDEINKSAGEQCTRDLFGTLTVALGKMGHKDLEAINKDTLIDDWAVDFFDDVVKQVRRFVMGNKEQGYAIAHPRLRQHMRTKIKTEIYTRKILDFCAFWQEHYSLYALRHYAEHLKNAKQWNDLYTLARNQNFAYIQSQHLPNEADLSLKTIQLALSCAAEENNAGLMAEFMLKHAHWIESIKEKESPLEALRGGSLERALKLVEIYELERQILWFLLLAWELNDTGEINKSRLVLERLDQKNLPRYQKQNTFWLGDHAAYFLAHLFKVSNTICYSLQAKLLDDDYRRHLCKYLCDINNFVEAVNITFYLQQDIDKAWQLTYIAKLQAIKGDKASATNNFETAIDFIKKYNNKSFVLYEMLRIIEEMINVGFIESAKINLEEIYQEAQKLNDCSEKEAILRQVEILRKRIEFKENNKLTVFNYELDNNILLKIDDVATNSSVDNSKLENTNTLISRVISLIEENNIPAALKVVEEINDKIRVEEVICQIALLLTDKKQYDQAAIFAKNIQDTNRRTQVQGQIAMEEAITRQAEARTKFSATIQAAQESATLFIYIRTLISIANFQIKSQQEEAGEKNILYIYNFIEQLNNLRHKLIMLARLAEAFANSGDKNKARDILQNAKEQLDKATVQQGIFSTEDADSLRAIALAEARMKDFIKSRQTAKKVGFGLAYKVLQTIATLQAADKQWEESLITVNDALEHPSFFTNDQELSILCTKAILEAARDKVSLQTTFEELLKFARESEKQRDIYLSTIAVALAEADEIPTSNGILNEIDDPFELLKVILAISWKQFCKRKEVIHITTAIEAKNKIRNEKKLLQALNIIAQIQVISGLGSQAIKTVEGILTNREWYVPGIASLFVETADKENFNKLLIPCAYNLDTAYEMCSHIARMYPKQAQAVAEVITEFNLVSSTNKSAS
nr:NACHT domain-containing protein [Nostoc sp. ChiSLP03a]MDZ8210793.1 NACHT domain-containing protein [Nostoc sp. ChiSLP03a]